MIYRVGERIAYRGELPIEYGNNSRFVWVENHVGKSIIAVNKCSSRRWWRSLLKPNNGCSIAGIASVCDARYCPIQRAICRFT